MDEDQNQDQQEEMEKEGESEQQEEEKQQEQEEEEIEPEIRAAASSGEDESKEDEEIAPEDKQAIEKVARRLVEKEMAPIREQTLKHEVDNELVAHPEYKPYEKRIRAFVNHPNRRKLIDQGLPVSTVVLEAIAPHLQEIGAAKEREASANVSQSRGGGSTSRPSSAEKKDWRFVTKEEFEAERARVLNQPRK